MTALDQLDQLVDHGSRLGDLGAFALDREPVAAQQDRAAEAPAEGVEDTVADRGQLGGDVVRDGQNFLHLPQCRDLTSGRARPQPIVKRHGFNAFA